jgi:dihydrofolate reductase
VSQEIAAILAVDLNNGLGFENKILFSNPVDMKHFQTITKDYYNCVVGRKTDEDLPFLKHRYTYVLSRQGKNLFPRLKQLDRFIVIGGNEIYKLFKDSISVWYVTYFKQKAEQVDTYLDSSVIDVINSITDKEIIFEDDVLSIIKYYK